MKLPIHSHAVPTTFKNFWRKNKKSKRGASIVEESRDEETEVNLPQQAVTAPVAAMMPHTETTLPPVVPVTTASVELRDDVELVQPGTDEAKQEPDQSSASEDKLITERSQTQDEVNASSESTANNTGIVQQKKEDRAPPSTKSKKNRLVLRQTRQPSPRINAGYNTREPNLSQTYSQASSDSDNYSWNEYDNDPNHIYLRDNESVSVLTKEYRDPNIMDVLSLEAVMDVVNKGIITRDGGEKDNRRNRSRLNGNMDEKDENSVDGLMNCLWNALDCCGENSLVSERQCYADRCHGIRGGGFGSKIVLNEDGHYFDRSRKSNINGIGSAGMQRIEEREFPENAVNNGVEGKSVSWADDTVDNIILDGSLNDSLLDKVDQETSPNKQHFNLSRSNSSDGTRPKFSVRSAVASSLNNVKNVIKCATSSEKQPIDADTVYEQHRNAMMKGNGVTNDNNPNQDNPNWREMVNENSNGGENWRATVNDRLNYQGPNSPASSIGAGFSTMGGMPPPHQHCDQWGNASPPMPGAMNVTPHVPMARMPSGHQSVNASPPPPMAMNGRIPSIGNRSVVSSMINASFSIESEDIGDKYGIEGEEEAMRSMTRNYEIGNQTASIGGPQYECNSQYPQYHTQQLRNQDSVIGGSHRYNDGYRVPAAPTDTTQMNTMHDHRMNHGQERQDFAYSNAAMPRQYPNGIAQPHENYGSQMHQQNHPQMINSMQVQPMMQGYDYQQRPPISPPAPASARRTFMA